MPPRKSLPCSLIGLAAPALAAALAVSAPVPAGAQQEARCGAQPIAIARMQWPSAAILAEIHARILEREFGCEVRIVSGDLAATGSSMATTSQPALAPEMWVARIADVWNSAVGAQRVRPAASTYSGGDFEGWYVPGYLAEAYPGLTSVADIADFPQAFAPGPVPAAPAAAPEDEAEQEEQEGEQGQESEQEDAAEESEAPVERGRFISCPANWACAVLNRNLLEAWGLTGRFEVIEPANRFELDQLIAEAMSRQEPVLFYYWQPNSVLAQFDFHALDMGRYDPEAFTCLGRRSCDALEPTSFVPETVVIAVAEWVFAEAPAVGAYLQRASMPLAEMNALLAQQGAEGGAFEEAAERFVAEREEIWRPWVGD